MAWPLGGGAALYFQPSSVVTNVNALVKNSTFDRNFLGCVPSFESPELLLASLVGRLTTNCNDPAIVFSSGGGLALWADSADITNGVFQVVDSVFASNFARFGECPGTNGGGAVAVPVDLPALCGSCNLRWRVPYWRLVHVWMAAPCMAGAGVQLGFGGLWSYNNTWIVRNCLVADNYAESGR